MLVLSLSVRGLECSFHRLIFLYVLVQKVFYAIQRAKLLLFFRMAKILQGNFASKQKRKQHVAFFFCDSEAIRTLDPRLRRALLYPAELRNRPYGKMAVPFSSAKIVCFFVSAKDFSFFLKKR